MVVLQQSKLWHCGILFYYHKVHVTSTMNSRVCQAKGVYSLQSVLFPGMSMIHPYLMAIIIGMLVVGSKLER
jgi:hypothetical protein